MRILHVLDHSIPLHSGYTFRSRAILQQQRELGWETFHVTGPKHNVAATVEGDVEEVDGLRFYRSPTPSGWMTRLPVLNQWAIVAALEKRLEEVVKEVRPDILHAHSPMLDGEAAVRVGKRHGIPVVYEIRAFWEDAAVDHGTATEGGLRYRLTRALETRVIHRADAVTTICEGLRKEIVARDVAPEKVTVIPNAVDIARFQADRSADPTLQEELGLKDKWVLGFIGSFYAYEGLTLLLKAFPEILKQRPDARLLLVGGGPKADELRRITEEQGLQAHVIFTGRVPHEQVQRYYDLVDIFVYPRLPMRLTEIVTPLKPLEAMAQKRLVVASDVGGHKELIRDGETGWLFPAGDAHALANCVLGVLSQTARLPEVRAAGRRFVEEERNWVASVRRYKPVYERLLGAGVE
ncbi:glycosyl transferase family 1 [Candidatus Tenderia electrophaga]|jgi:PEP-CTERM/exosortase A-associated glycosyltransferase|uniref:Glycosyl transferase family 1 n=1 Tax=Candidatus Tenderia electrophaga TaxID=1748243 RepID=A0A0S2TG23_9GAMM|nr:glycosyl transferase family 1 [Candidatus Tenderia electrophaga]